MGRLRRLHTWDDLVAYTPSRPKGESAAAPLRDDELYTRGTVGLYLTQNVSGLLDDQMAMRLRSVLAAFFPRTSGPLCGWRRRRTWSMSTRPAPTSPRATSTGIRISTSSALPKTGSPRTARLGHRNDRPAIDTAGAAAARPRVRRCDAAAADLTSLRFRSYAPPPQ